MKRSTNSAPLSLSTSYLIGSAFIGISMITLNASGASSPGVTLCKLMGTVEARGKTPMLTPRAPRDPLALEGLARRAGRGGGPYLFALDKPTTSKDRTDVDTDGALFRPGL